MEAARSEGSPLHQMPGENFLAVYRGGDYIMGEPQIQSDLSLEGEAKGDLSISTRNPQQVRDVLNRALRSSSPVVSRKNIVSESSLMESAL